MPHSNETFMKPRSVTLVLEDTFCLGGTAQSLEQVLRALPGVHRAYVNAVTEAAYVEFDANLCTDADLVQAAESLGLRVGACVPQTRAPQPFNSE